MMWDSKKKFFALFMIVFIAGCLLLFFFVRKGNDDNTTMPGQPTPTPAAGAMTLTVCIEQADGCNYIGAEGIQEAILAAKDGTTIVIKKGSYPESALKIGSGGIAAKQNLAIRGEGVDTALVGNNFDHVFTIAGASKVVISNLSVKEGGGDGINVSGEANVSISNCQFSDNHYSALAFMGNADGFIYSSTIEKTETYGGITTGQNSTVLISGNKISANRTFGIEAQGSSSIQAFSNLIMSNGSSGIGTFNESRAAITNNTIVDNRDHGLTINDNSQVNLVNNISAYNQNLGIVAVRKELISALLYNLTYANRSGNWNSDFNEWPLATNVTLNPIFVDRDVDDYHLQTGSPAKDAGDPSLTDADGSRSDIGAYGGLEHCKLEQNLPACVK